ncbi:MAG: T9SS type A sorting domain-containing protein [Saprospiraceae bacterium]|nr:T9SS type A sorting domain-containing protein [Saprospiraceae bacterium]
MKHILFLILTIALQQHASAQCIVLQNCPSNLTFCDLSPNDANLWNESYWTDPLNQTNDLSEAGCDLSLSAYDTCANATIGVKYLLFLDLDRNGAAETVIKSWDPPAPGTVNYNNWNLPNYDGGEVRTFDERPVPADQKYQFAIETITTGDTIVGKVRWNTEAAPNSYVDAQLPLGVSHKIRWIVEDNLGNDEVCEPTIQLNDCKAPIVVCINGLSVNLMPTQQVTIWATDFLQYMEDNATPSYNLDFAIRKQGTGTGFPVDGNGDPVISLTYDCTELGTQVIELWSRDASGNADYCQTYLIVQDNQNNCGGGGGGNIPPTVVCTSGQTVYYPQGGGAVDVYAPFLLAAAYDDQTPFNMLVFGERKSGTGTGFPLDGNNAPINKVTFDETEAGVQLIELWARDQDGNADYCETFVIVEEGTSTGVSPTIVCLNGLSANLMPTAMISLWATDFLQYVEDDNTPTNQIELGIRKQGTGTGFPEDAQGNPLTNVIYDCDELGTQQIELWARDLDGNTAYCETYAIIQDNLGSCSGVVDTFALCVHRWCDQSAVPCNYSISGSSPFAPPFQFFDNRYFDDQGCAVFTNDVPVSSNFTITPELDTNPTNGVTPLDLVKIAQHILGVEPLGSPYAMIAADINRSNSITTFDIVESRKLIAGTYVAFPQNTSWRFVDADFVFPNPNNPFQSQLQETIELANLQDNTASAAFVAIKVGDVDCDATPSEAHAPADSRSVQHLNLPDADLAAGETVAVPVTFEEANEWLALATGLSFDPQQLEIESIIPGTLSGMEADLFLSPKPGVMNMVWFSPTAQAVHSGEVLYTLQLRARAPLRLSETITFTQPDTEHPHMMRSEGYDKHETPYTLQAAFRGHVAPSNFTGNHILPAQPNPTTGATTIPLRLIQEERVQATLTDLSGRVLWQANGTYSAGIQLLEIPGEALPQAGVYTWRVQAGTTVAEGKVIRL